MLSKLTVKNVALIEHAEIEFTEGLNVLSGETGAGKSVILDSVNFVLGAKADKTMIRHGETECMVKAEFFVPETSKAVEVLREMDVETDGEIIISRKYAENGKNSIKINGNSVTASMLRSVTDSLVDVHGQSEHFFLLKESNQLKTLDEVIGAPIEELKQTLSSFLQEKKKIDEDMALLGGDEEERARTLSLLAYQITEIEDVDLKDGEEEELNAKRIKINNLEKILYALKEASEALSGENGAIDALRASKRALSSVSSLDQEYENYFERAESLCIEADDIAEGLSDLADGLYFDENEAAETEARLDVIRDLKRKYGANKQEIDEYLAQIKEKHDFLADSDAKYSALEKKRAALLKKIYDTCRTMTGLRKTEGEKFCNRVTEELKTLNIASAQFKLSFTEYLPEDAERATVNGLDGISFLFSANAGEPLKPLNKIISGGEMSRFMLAIKTQLSSVNGISTYVFDEIDAGISGKTAKVVGEKFAKIAKSTQIIAVSHLAQIAAMSDGEFLIEKIEEGGKTHTSVYSLDSESKKKEIVRLLGGDTGDEFAFQHAEELLKQANEYKKSL
ncbi:MAG: DNA repair protein RecN [Clostridia bacterium]|nr:DNA repair protein RecN [Clostridia bacterium]